MLFSGAIPWPADTTFPSLARGHMHPKPALSISKDVLRHWTWQGTKREGTKNERQRKREGRVAAKAIATLAY